MQVSFYLDRNHNLVGTEDLKAKPQAGQEVKFNSRKYRVLKVDEDGKGCTVENIHESIKHKHA